jgi:hypothetical protein
MTDLVEKEECFKEAEMSEQKMRDECHPQPPTCHEEARNWIEEKLAECQNNPD